MESTSRGSGWVTELVAESEQAGRQALGDAATVANYAGWHLRSRRTSPGQIEHPRDVGHPRQRPEVRQGNYRSGGRPAPPDNKGREEVTGVPLVGEINRCVMRVRSRLGVRGGTAQAET